MSVQSTLARIGYTISGAGPYTIPYYFLKDVDLVVIRTPIVGDPVTLVMTTDYTVTGAGLEAGGALTLVAPVNGDLLTIINEPPINQLSTFPETGKLPAKSIESALDKLTMVMKRVYDLASRGLRLNDGDSATSFVFPISASGKLIGWGSDGKLTNTTAAGVGPNSIGATEIIDGAVTVAKIADPQLTTLAGITAQQAADLASLSTLIGTLLSKTTKPQALGALGAPLNTISVQTTNFTVTNSHMGVLFTVSGTTTALLSSPGTLGANFLFGVRNSGVNQVTVNSNGAGIDGVGSITLMPGETCFCICDGTTFATFSRIANPFEVNQSLSESGYQKIPGGLILQWGKTAVTSNGVGSATLPTSFPLAAFVGWVIGTAQGSGAEANHHVTGVALNTLSFVNNSTVAQQFYFFAIGK